MLHHKPAILDLPALAMVGSCDQFKLWGVELVSVLVLRGKGFSYGLNLPQTFVTMWALVCRFRDKQYACRGKIGAQLRTIGKWRKVSKATHV